MTHKQFVLILAVWFAVITFIFVTPAKSKEVGIVKTQGAPTCAEAKQDLLAVSIRLNHLKDEFQAETNDSLRFVIKEEATAVAKLGRTIVMFMQENCRAA